MKRAFVGAYWGPRAESLDACVERSLSYLLDLKESHKLLATWYKRAASPAASLAAPLASTPEHIEALLLEGRNRRDSDGSVIEQLGYGLGAWNGANAIDSATVDVSCAVTSERVPNSVRLRLPERGSGTDDLYEHDPSIALVSSLARHWVPGWASFTSKELRRSQQAREQGRIVLGQHTYLANERGAVPPLPAPFVTTQLDGLGTIVSIVGVEPSAELIAHLIELLGPDLLRK